MAGFDLFGLKKGSSSEEPAPGPADASPPAAPRTLPAKTWKGLAAADAAVLLACLCLLAVRVRGHLSAPPPPPARPLPAKKAEPRPEPKAEAPKADPAPETKRPEAKPEPKPEAKKPEPKKAEPKKAEAKKPEPEPKAAAKNGDKKVPLGSPAVHAAPAPRREPTPVGAAPAALPPPSMAPKAKKEKSATRPVPFSHEDDGAKEVYLVGPFLVRSGGRKTMFKDSRGVWQTTVYLNIGQAYKYRFEVVGESGKKLTPARSVEVLEAE